MERENFLFKLQILSGQNIDYQVIEKMMSFINCEEIHMYNITERKSDKFIWKNIINILIPKKITTVKNIVSYCNNVVNNIETCLKIGNHKFYILKQYYSGTEIGNSLIISNYLFNKQSQEFRNKTMYEHFQFEKEQQLYNSFHFNTVLNVDWKNNKEVDFIFEGYLDCQDNIRILYEQPFIQKMRKHSENFLDTSTRQLAFGEIKILKKQR